MIAMVEVLAFNVRPVVVEVFQIVPVPERFIVEAPSVSVLVLELEESNNPLVIVCPLVSSVPLVSVTVAALPVFSAPVSFQEPLEEALKVTFPALFPPKSTF